MKHDLSAWQFFLIILAREVIRHQQDAIRCLEAENRALRERIGCGASRLRYNALRTTMTSGGVRRSKEMI